MIIPKNKFPGQVDTTDPAYPHGKAQACAFDGDGTGTPFAKDDLNDRWGFQSSLLAAAGMVPSGIPETSSSSQLVDAIKYLINEATPASTTWQSAKGCPYGSSVVMEEIVALNNGNIVAVGYDATTSKGVRGVSTDNAETFTFVTDLDYRIFAAATNGADLIAVGENVSGGRIVYKTSDGLTWTEHLAPPITAYSAAISGNSWVVGNADSIYLSVNEGVGWAEITPPGTLTLRNIRYLGGIIFACHSGGVVQSGNNGTTWAGLVLSNQNWTDIARRGNEIIVVSDDVKKVAYSPGTGTFTELGSLPNSAVAATLNKIVYNGRGSYYAIGISGVFTVPTGGATPFVPMVTNFHGNTITVTSTGRLVLGGNEGMIVYSG